MKLISPSKLAITGANFKPIGVPAKTPGRCLMCGFEHQKGDLVVDSNLSDSFTNWADLAAPASHVICGYCASSSQDPWTQAWMHAVITEKGVYKFASNNDIAYWLLNPPSTPFIMMKGDQQKQHLVWRTPVNYSREIYQVRIGEKMVTIRLKHLLSARDSALALSALLEEQAQITKKTKATKFYTPFIRPVREMDDYVAGRLRREVEVMAQENDIANHHAKVLKQCTPGEIWALTAVLYATEIDSPTLHALKV